jgi:hypothetical protein
MARDNVINMEKGTLSQPYPAICHPQKQRRARVWGRGLEAATEPKSLDLVDYRVYNSHVLRGGGLVVTPVEHYHTCSVCDIAEGDDVVNREGLKNAELHRVNQDSCMDSR